MAYISQLKYENADDKTKKVIDEWVASHGPLTNMKETLIHSIPAFHALMEWFPLEEEIESFLGARAVNFFCYAISTENDCLVCGMFFKKILDDEGISFAEFSFTEEEEILIDYGKAIVRDANHVDPDTPRVPLIPYLPHFLWILSEGYFRARRRPGGCRSSRYRLFSRPP